MSATTIDPAGVHFPHLSRLDPMGRVFLYEGGVYRGVVPEQAAFVRELLEGGTLDELADLGLLVRTKLTELRLEPFGLVLEHEPLQFVPPPREWPYACLLRAAKDYLRLYRLLGARGLTLLDGHHSNFGFAANARPLWCDVGSIVPAQPGSLHGLVEWLEFFYYPLKLAQRAGLPMVRRMGVVCSRSDYHACAGPSGYRLLEAMRDAIPHSRVRGVLERTLRFRGYEYLRSASFGERLALARGRLSGEPAHFNDVPRFLDALEAELDALGDPWRKTQWAGYVGDPSQLGGPPQGARQQAVDRILAEVEPDQVLDVGSNLGVFSHLAYRRAPKVYAMDTDEESVSRHAELLWRLAEPRAIYPVVCDPTLENATGLEVYRSHTTLALALTHHLAIGQGRAFEHIAFRLAYVTTRCLIVEFMPRGLSTPGHPRPVPAGYTLDGFLDALRGHFDRVAVVESCPVDSSHPRIMIRCDKQAR